LQLQEH